MSRQQSKNQWRRKPVRLQVQQILEESREFQIQTKVMDNWIEEILVP